MKKIAVLHTTPSTVGLIKELASKIIPDVTVYNIMDDSVLPKLREDETNITKVFEKMLKYAQFAEDLDVDLILNACSSIGEFDEYARTRIKTKVQRIDEPMAEIAAGMGRKIVVAATLGTTLKPSYHLIRKKCEGLDREVKTCLLSDAYDAMQKGNKAEHDRIIADALRKLVAEYDVVALAQASMADAVGLLTEEERAKVISSPVLGLQRVKELLQV